MTCATPRWRSVPSTTCASPFAWIACWRSRALLPTGVPELSYPPGCDNRRWAVVALAGLLASARLARADVDDDVDEELRALPPPPLPNARWLTLETPHFELHFYPDEQRVRDRVGARRRARLPSDHALPQLGAGRPRQRGPHRRGRRGERRRQLGAVQLHLGVRRASRRDGRAVRLRRLREAADHPRVHARRAPGHHPQLVPALRRLRAREDLRAQPGAADLVHRGPGRADGDAADDGGPPAQQLLRHAPAGAVPRGTTARDWTRSRSGSARSSTPAAASPTSTDRACSATWRIATAPRRSARSRTGTRTNASPAGSTAPRGPRSAAPTRNAFGADIWNDWKRSASHKYALQIEEAERRGLTSARRLTFDAPSPRGTLPRPVFFRDGTLIFQRENNDEVPAYVRLDPATGARERIDGGVRRRARLADARTDAGRVPARRLHSPGLAHLRQRPLSAGTTSTSSTSSAGRCGR